MNPAGGIGQGVLAAFVARGRIAAGESGEGFFHVIRGQGAVAPLVAVGTFAPATIGVVQQDKFVDGLVLVGGDVFAEEAEGSVALAFLDVPKDLVVGSVLLDNIYDMLEHARFPRPLGDGARFQAGARRQFRGGQQWITQVGQGALRQPFQLARVRRAGQGRSSRAIPGNCIAGRRSPCWPAPK